MTVRKRTVAPLWQCLTRKGDADHAWHVDDTAGLPARLRVESTPFTVWAWMPSGDRVKAKHHAGNQWRIAWRDGDGILRRVVFTVASHAKPKRVACVSMA